MVGFFCCDFWEEVLKESFVSVAIMVATFRGTMWDVGFKGQRR